MKKTIKKKAIKKKNIKKKSSKTPLKPKKVLKKKSVVKVKPRVYRKDYSNYKCNLVLKVEKEDLTIFVCEANRIMCNGTKEDFKNCPLKVFIKRKEKEIKVYKNFFKIKKLKPNEDML